MKKIAILGEFNPSSETHAATDSAILHSKNALGIDLGFDWISTNKISEILLETYDGYWVAPGSPYKDMEKVLYAIEFARKNNIPILGTCGGFQHMIIEYARNVLGYQDAQHAEYTPDGGRLFISPLPCSLRGREMTLEIAPHSKVASLYGDLQVIEKYYCSFGVNPEYLDVIRKGPIRFVGSNSEGGLRILEFPEHRFFIGTLYVPQANSTGNKPHPVVTGFLKALYECETWTTKIPGWIQ